MKLRSKLLEEGNRSGDPPPGNQAAAMQETVASRSQADPDSVPGQAAEAITADGSTVTIKRVGSRLPIDHAAERRRSSNSAPLRPARPGAPWAHHCAAASKNTGEPQ